MNLKNMIKFALILPLALCCGCNIGGLLMGETLSEKSVKAQYKIADRAKTGVLVLVDQSNFANAPQYLRNDLTEMINILLAKKARVGKKYIITADPTSPERKKIATLAHMPPEKIAAEMGVKTVLHVSIVSCSLSPMENREYYYGSLSVRSVLLGDQGEKFWPEREASSIIRTRVELETSGRKATVTRLAKAAAHCIVRNFYNCPRPEYNIMDEQREYNSGDLIF